MYAACVKGFKPLFMACIHSALQKPRRSCFIDSHAALLALQPALLEHRPGTSTDVDRIIPTAPAVYLQLFAGSALNLSCMHHNCGVLPQPGPFMDALFCSWQMRLLAKLINVLRCLVQTFKR